MAAPRVPIPDVFLHLVLYIQQVSARYIITLLLDCH